MDAVGYVGYAVEYKETFIYFQIVSERDVWGCVYSQLQIVLWTVDHVPTITWICCSKLRLHSRHRTLPLMPP